MTVELEGFVLRHVGIDVDFYHEKGADLAIAKEVEDLYGIEKENAPVFVRNRDGEAFTPEDMMKVFLSRTDQPLQEFVVEGSMGRGKHLARAVFPMSFPEGMIHMETEDGNVDLRTLRIAVHLEPGSRVVRTEENTA